MDVPWEWAAFAHQTLLLFEFESLPVHITCSVCTGGHPAQCSWPFQTNDNHNRDLRHLYTELRAIHDGWGQAMGYAGECLPEIQMVSFESLVPSRVTQKRVYSRHHQASFTVCRSSAAERAVGWLSSSVLAMNLTIKTQWSAQSTSLWRLKIICVYIARALFESS
jgi:hypothetical protein